MSQALALYRLQEIELGIANAQKRLGEIAAALEDRTAISDAQNRVALVENALKPQHVKMRNLELEIQSNLAKSRETEQHLYSGKVRNPKELQDMQQEIESLKHWYSELENRLLEVMVTVEEAEARLSDETVLQRQVTASWESQHKDLLQEKQQLESRLAALREQHHEALAPVTVESLKAYTALKPRKNNQPVALMQGRSCTICGIEQTSALEQEVRRGRSLITCHGCGRILVHLSTESE